MKAVFIELPPFERYRKALMTDDEYFVLQNELLANPEKGDLIQGSGGVRKIRISDEKRNKGKRGGARVIYYWFSRQCHFLMITAYSKKQKDDLAPEEIKAISQLIKHIKEE
ncbi:type II toxin-antitoxin system RelE/ParE family toxin [Avibacterium volantium]|uniref:type II toxin-antitoxin system RelE/ParE family toxin n=1 Tax=Avibacterium volantium TaxID=762 RepID=UPI003BF78B33